jgi:hypothetical protein
MPKQQTVVEKLEIIRHEDGREWYRHKGRVILSSVKPVSQDEFQNATWRIFGGKLGALEALMLAVVIRITHPQFTEPWTKEGQKTYGG